MLNEIKRKVIDARLNGATYTQIFTDYGVAKSTAQGWVGAFNANENIPIGYVNDNLRRIKPTKKDTQVSPEEFMENLVPLVFPLPEILKVKSELSNFAIVCSDMHFPTECKKSVDILFQTIIELKPSTIILNGDTCDMLAISKYPADILTSWNLNEERIAYQKFLQTLVSISGGAKIYETHANHSSQGIQGRWRRYLSEKLGSLACLSEFWDNCTYEKVFMGDFAGIIETVDYVDLNGLLVMHGDVVRSNAGASALGMIQKFSASVMIGHVHRLGATAIRRPAIAGKTDVQHMGYEIGCMCDLNPVYASAPNWQNGFAIVSLSDNTFGVELVSISNGKSSICTLGKTLFA
jgi:hypothetical protein